jgi:uncharacterized protein
MDIQQITNNLKKLLYKNNVCESHGIDHAIKVMNHATKALESFDYNLTQEETKCVLLAALLHDADDSKFFPKNTQNENVRLLLSNEQNVDSINLIIEMVNLVSSSKNADIIPPNIIDKEWMLIPRYSDRLEAIGIIGIKRCYQYNKTSNRLLFVDTTPRVKTIEELWMVASIERYNNYCGKSVSMIDHYYDKLLRLCFFPIKNEYLINMSKIRIRPVIDFILYFGEKYVIDDNDIINFINMAETKY